MFYRKAAFALLLAFSLTLAPIAGYAQDPSEQASFTISYSATSEDPSKVPASYEDAQGRWVLVSSKVTYEPSKKTKAVVHKETVQCAPSALESARVSFAPEMDAEEGGVSAHVSLEDVSFEPVYGTVEIECNQVMVYSGLPDNDMARVPSSWTGTVEGSPVESTLDLAGCTWSVELDANGLPSGYSATALYRGLALFDDLYCYDVTATYSGQAEIDDEGGMRDYSVEAVYEREPQGVALWLPLAVLAAISVGGLGFAIAAYRRKNATFYKGVDGAFRKVGRGLAKRQPSGTYALAFPKSYDLSKNPYKVELRRDVATSARIVIMQGEQVLYQGRANQVIDIHMLSAKREGAENAPAN